MARLISLAVLVTVAASAADAQSARGGTCSDCNRDSSVRATVKRRAVESQELTRLTQLAEELSSVRARLDGDRDLNGGEQRRLAARAAKLEAELSRLGTRLGMERASVSIERIHPGAVGAHRAMSEAVAESRRVRVAREATRFAGWIGLTLDAPSAVEQRGPDVYWRFLDLPRVVSVDPNSPADRAGIRRDDVVLAYNGKDVRHEIAMNRLLRPGRMITVRVRRQDAPRDFTVRVAPAREVVARDWAPGVAVAPRSAVRVPLPPRPPDEPWAPFPHSEPGTPAALPEPFAVAPPAISILRVPNGFAGAHMETITPGLADAIGVDRGVLVLSVAHGMPAHEAGLRDGDVIVAANGRPVGAFRDLVGAVAGSDDRSVALDVTRKGKTRKVTLRW